jgi:hypothetical protein
MPQSIAGQLQSIPMSPSLGQSLARAQDFAREQSHRALMLEHLLLALTEDPDAAGVLRACNVDLDRLGTDVSGYLGGLLDDMRAPPGTDPSPDQELLRVVEAARQAAQQSKRRAIDGAIVLAAIVGDGKSPAAGLLKAHGMTFEEAIRTLQKASAQARSKQYTASARPASERPAAAEPVEMAPPAPAPIPPPAPAPAAPPPAWAPIPPNPPPDPPGTGSADEILAAARTRIQQRSGSTPGKPEPRPAAAPPPVEPETLPLMSLSAFTASSAAPGPVPDDLPPMIGRLPGQPEPGGGPLAAPPPPPPPPAAPPRQGVPEPSLSAPPPPPGACGGAGEGPPRLPPMPPGAVPGGPPPRLPERLQRAELRPDPADAPPTRRPPPVAPNGALPGQRRPGAEAGPGRPATRPAGPPPRGGQRAAPGPLIEAIPRRMRVGAATMAQVRIGRDKVDGLMQLLMGNRAQLNAEAVVARVLSVRLRAPDGGFAIESATPETQWIETPAPGQPGQPQDEHIAWQWDVTPQRRGRGRLQLLVSARAVGRDGITAETAPPERIIEVAVRPRLLQRLVRLVAVLVLFGLGVGLGRVSHDGLAQDAWDLGTSLVSNVLGLLRTSGFLGG